MSNTERFKDLSNTLDELKINLLPKRFSQTGSYKESIIDKARAYRLLVHAEIESYLEEVAIEIVTNSIQKWKSSKKPSITLVSFLTCYHSSWFTTEEKVIIDLAKRRKNIKEKTDEVIDEASTQFRQRINGNHGIKEENLLLLILPTGVDFDQLDPTWLTEMTNYGAIRGEIAHKAKKTTRQVNPKDEYDTINKLRKGIKDYDAIINKLFKEINK